jgi:uncharacterized protein YecT (DUF1311 family)
MRSAAAFLIMLAALPCFAQLPGFAQISDPLQRCLDTAMTQVEITRCMSEDVGRGEAELKDVYQKLLAAVANDPQAVAKITAAEKAWVAYRDAYIEAMWPSDNKQFYGSIFPANQRGLRAILTRQHIEDVKELLKEHTGGNAH